MIIFDEKKYAEGMIKSGFKTNHKNVYEIYILSKYYFHEGHELEQVKEYITKFCNKHIKYFSEDEWYKIINRTVRSASKGELKTNKKVVVTQKELDRIGELKINNEKKVAFTLLVFYKFFECRRFKVTIEDIFKHSHLNLNSKSKLKLLHSLTSQKLIDIDTNGRRSVNFVDKRGKAVIEINDFDDFIFEYLRYICDGKFTNCIECRKTIKINGRHKKYCKQCSIEINRRKTKERMRIQRMFEV